MSANSRQVAGQHYAAKIQHWDYVLQALQGRYLEGNITKYVCRHRRKNGLQDLEKALHYLDKLVEEFVNGRVNNLVHCNVEFPMAEFIAENGLSSTEAFIVKRLAHWYRVDHLESVRHGIETLIKEERDYQRRTQAIKAGAEPGRGYINQG